MEGRHFGAGPWFTVQNSNEGWEQVDSITLTNAVRLDRARVEVKLALEDEHEIASL